MNDTLETASMGEFVTNATIATHQEISTGCMQRIAEAVEEMAKSRVKLEAERDYFERRFNNAWESLARRDRSNAALRGVITKMNKRIDDLCDIINKEGMS